MKIVTAEQMRALDKRCIDELGIPSLALMEIAGGAVTKEVLRLLYERPGLALLLCGKGNNGGDGLVIARLLHEAGYDTKVILPFSRESLSHDAGVMYERAVEVGVAITPTVSDAELAGASVVIDALLGTGVSGPVYGVLGELISRTNAARGGKGVLAVDLPSGVNADTGEISGPTISAEVTVTLALPKPCLVLYPAARQAGRWTVADIGFPQQIIEETPCIAEIPDRADVASWVPKRPPTAHKHTAGWVLAVAGSFGMTGAATMTCTSAYRSGAGLVRLALPTSLVSTLNATLTEVVFRPMPETPAHTLSFKALKPLLAEAPQMQAALIGPGLSRNAATQNAIRRFIARWPKPLVVDADALTAMAGEDALWKARTAPTIITPHPGEMSRLLGKPIAELEADRIGTAKEAAARFKVFVVFKGAPTIIASPGGRVFVNPTGNAGLAVAGTGDVLAGSITALLGQGVPALAAAALATYAGGLAAEMLTAETGILGMTALDLIDGIAYALRDLAEE